MVWEGKLLIAQKHRTMITEVFIAVDRDEVYRATLPPGEYVIGRDADAQIRIQHPTISRRHAKLIVEEDQLVLSDLDSGNGTLIEETPVVGASHFYEGQTARLGDVLLRARQNVTPELLPPSIGNYRKGGVVASGGQAFAVDVMTLTAVHQPWCNVNLGANYCSCGADLAGYPLWEY